MNEVTLVASAVPSVKLFPKENRAAVGALPAGRRALVCAFWTDQRPDFAVYHGRAQEQPDQVYRKARDDDTKTWTDSHDRVWARRAKVRGDIANSHPFGHRDLQHRVLLSSHYWFAGSRLPPWSPRVLIQTASSLFIHHLFIHRLCII